MTFIRITTLKQIIIQWCKLLKLILDQSFIQQLLDDLLLTYYTLITKGH